MQSPSKISFGNARASGQVRSQCQRIYEYLLAQPSPVSSRSISEALGIEVGACAARVHKLKGLNLVRPHGLVTDSTTGMKVTGLVALKDA